MTEHLYMTDEDSVALKSFIYSTLNASDDELRLAPLIGMMTNSLSINPDIFEKLLEFTIGIEKLDVHEKLRESLSCILINDILNIVCHYTNEDTDVKCVRKNISQTDGKIIAIHLFLVSTNFCYSLSCIFLKKNTYGICIYPHTANDHVIKHIFLANDVPLTNLDDINSIKYYNDEVDFMNYITECKYYDLKDKYCKNGNEVISNVSLLHNDGVSRPYKLLRTILDINQLKQNITILRFILQIIDHAITEYQTLEQSKNELDALI